jgi:NAD(P)-dependent dehydrogenase (short-subunit alcohol dehydrogenase family)
MGRLSGKTAIVTGAARGIGAAIATRFAAEGASVVVADILPDLAEETASRLRQTSGQKVIALACDVADAGSILAMHAAARASLGPIDVLVNNAGVNVFRDPLQSTQADWARCMAVDLEGAWLCTRAVLPDMIARHDGAVINIISNHAMVVMRGTFPYPVAKHALLGLTRSLALEYAGQGVSINAISPGYTDTQLAVDEFNRHPDPAEARRAVEALQPPGRLCRPDEVAAIAVMLASDEARFMIGENVVIDGGVSIRMYE